MNLDIVINTRTLRILKALVNGRRDFSTLQRLSKVSPGTLEKYLRELENMGLVRVTKDLFFPFTSTIMLTPKGKKVFDLMLEIKAKIENPWAR